MIVKGGLDKEPGRDRAVFLTSQLVNALGRYLDRRPGFPNGDHVFIPHSRSPTSPTIQRRLAAYGERSDVQVSPHRLRHTIGSRLINQGMPIHSLKKLLGHRRLDATKLYTRIYDEPLYQQFEEAMSRLEAIEVNAWPSPKTEKQNLV